MDRVLRFIICILLLVSGVEEILAQKSSGEGFVLVREDDDIFVYERWIDFPKSNPPVRAREVKGEFKIKTSLNDALALIQNEQRIQEWQKHVSEFKVYPDNDTLWYEYSYHDIPWPVSDQDHFLVYRIEDQVPGEKIFLTFETIANAKLAPVRDNVSRMKLSGSWLLEKVDEKSIKATYRILSMPSSIPRIFTDPVIRSNLMSTIKSYIRILESKK